MSLISIVYISSARQLFSDQALHELLDLSRRNNATRDITGLLLYWDGNFLQYVEGPEAAVDALLDRIRIDPRHDGVIVLDRATIAERAFPDWRMGYQRLKQPEPANGGMSTYLGDGDLGQQADTLPSHVRHLIELFRDNMR